MIYNKCRGENELSKTGQEPMQVEMPNTSDSEILKLKQDITDLAFALSSARFELDHTEEQLDKTSKELQVRKQQSDKTSEELQVNKQQLNKTSEELQVNKQ